MTPGRAGTPLPSASLGIVGVPFSGGQPRGGVEHGPGILRKAGVVEQLRKYGGEVVDAGDVDTTFGDHDPDHGNMKKPRVCGEVMRRIRDKVAEQAAHGRMVLTLGGDHSLGAGTVAGTASVHNDLAVIWVDAHADINTPETTLSGNIHGMPVGWLLGMAQEHNVPGFEWIDKPVLSTDRIVYIGLRDLDAGERRILKEYGIRSFTMHDVDKYGIANVVDQALRHVDPHGERPVHVSFDIDALDPTEAPATGTPVRGGLTFREGCYICEEVARTGRMVGFDLVEVNPALGASEAEVEKTVLAACSLIRCAFGETLL